jgi:hypothetical protein
MGNFQKYWSQNVGQDFIVLDFIVGGRSCGRLMSPAHETQSMREIRLLRGRLPRKGGGLTGMIESVNVFVLLRFDLCHVLSSSTNNFAHAQTLSRMSSLSGLMNIARVNIRFFTGFKKIKQGHISFVLGYLRILWKISTAISIKN